MSDFTKRRGVSLSLSLRLFPSTRLAKPQDFLNLALRALEYTIAVSLEGVKLRRTSRGKSLWPIYLRRVSLPQTTGSYTRYVTVSRRSTLISMTHSSGSIGD